MNVAETAINTPAANPTRMISAAKPSTRQIVASSGCHPASTMARTIAELSERRDQKCQTHLDSIPRHHRMLDAEEGDKGDIDCSTRQTCGASRVDRLRDWSVDQKQDQPEDGREKGEVRHPGVDEAGGPGERGIVTNGASTTHEGHSVFLC